MLKFPPLICGKKEKKKKSHCTLYFHSTSKWLQQTITNFILIIFSSILMRDNKVWTLSCILWHVMVHVINKIWTTHETNQCLSLIDFLCDIQTNFVWLSQYHVLSAVRLNAASVPKLVITNSRFVPFVGGFLSLIGLFKWFN